MRLLSRVLYRQTIVHGLCYGEGFYAQRTNAGLVCTCHVQTCDPAADTRYATK